MKKIAILGAGGFLGTKLHSILSKYHQVIPYFFLTCPKIDITLKKDLQKLNPQKPEILIHAAGMTNVILCEKEQKKC